jgi:hypothetical protein
VCLDHHVSRILLFALFARGVRLEVSGDRLDHVGFLGLAG